MKIEREDERSWNGGGFDGAHRRTLQLFETTKTRRHPLYRIRFPGNHLLLLEAIARHNGQVIHPLRLLARETTTARGLALVFSIASARFPHQRHRENKHTPTILWLHLCCSLCRCCRLLACLPASLLARDVPRFQFPPSSYFTPRDCSEPLAKRPRSCSSSPLLTILAFFFLHSMSSRDSFFYGAILVFPSLRSMVSDQLWLRII